MDRTDELEALQAGLTRARRRLASSTRGGPEWDAAMDEVEDLEARIAALAGEGWAATPATSMLGQLRVVA
ncbi:MAG TPA: hypothetical protein VFK54_04640 [Candidatus Limnocylindrales bacterium]|nr:hypothetical protein [Candidatus Limnocylindrales bacterium]